MANIALDTIWTASAARRARPFDDFAQLYRRLRVFARLSRIRAARRACERLVLAGTGDPRLIEEAGVDRRYLRLDWVGVMAQAVGGRPL